MTGDPLYLDGVDLTDLGIMLIKVLVAFTFLLVATRFMVWFERKLISDMQNRIGPNVAGPWGLLQTFADGVKFFFKEDLRPENADPLIFRLAPYISAVTAFLSFAVCPSAAPWRRRLGHSHDIWSETSCRLRILPGILLLLAVVIAVYGVMLAGGPLVQNTY